MKKQSAPPKNLSISQTFSCKAHDATSVLLAGDFTNWQKHPIPLQKQADGIWRVTVSLSPGEHRYRFLVDNDWQDDPDCLLHIPNPYGSEDAIVRV